MAVLSFLSLTLKSAPLPGNILTSTGESASAPLGKCVHPDLSYEVNISIPAQKLFRYIILAILYCMRAGILKGYQVYYHIFSTTYSVKITILDEEKGGGKNDDM